MFENSIIINNKDYIVVKKVLSKDQCSLLSDYVHLKASVKPNIRRKQDPLHDIHREYGDAMMETLLVKLTPLVEQATGKSLWPTLSFCYHYRNNNQLKAHKDRSSCEYVAGLCIGSDDMQEQGREPWPMILHINDKAESIVLNYGDMVIFKGHEIEHWREPFPGQWFVSAIFGYVDKEGPFAFQKYDQRQALGKAHIGMFHWTYGCIKARIKRWF